MIFYRTIQFFFLSAGMLIVTEVANARTMMDGRFNDNEIPRISFDKAYVLSTACLGTNASQFVCTQARSIRTKNHGGWGLWFENDSEKAHYIHVDERGKVLINNVVYSPLKYRFDPLPSFSAHEAVESAIRVRQGTLLRVVWAGGMEVWQVRIMNQKGEKAILAVDAEKNVKLLNFKDTKWPPDSDLQVEADGI